MAITEEGYTLTRLAHALVVMTLVACGDAGHTGADSGLQQTIREVRSRAAPAEKEWRHYLGDQASNQFSQLAEINRDNVARLEVAWRYDAGGAEDNNTLVPTNPLVVEGVLYGLTARKDVFALDAATGEELWRFEVNEPLLGKGAGRGLVYWQAEGADGKPLRLILVGISHELMALNADTGQLYAGFADKGVLDARFGLDRPVDGLNVSLNVPGVVFEDLLIFGFSTHELDGAAPGYIRAYQLPSGELRWTFRTIPADGEYGAETWPAEGRDGFGGANAWAGLSLDEDAGVVYVPTGSAAYDFYGGKRRGDNLFATSLVALDARTGERLWHFQTVRHDVWDRDLPTPPNLVSVERAGESITAVAQATKSGHLFLFDRETGDSLYPIEEVPVAGAGLPGETLATTQPLPVLPPPFVPQQFIVTDRSERSQEFIRARIAEMNPDTRFPVPSPQGTVLYPGFDGGAEWGGQAWDQESGLLYVNANHIPSVFKMIPLTAEAPPALSPWGGYQILCAACHGLDREGNGAAFPSLVDIGERYWPWETYAILRDGRGRMPSFNQVPWYGLAAITWFLHTADEETYRGSQQVVAGEITGYLHDGYANLIDEEGLPGNKPPWGSLSAIDLSAGEIAWRVPLGDYPQILAQGLSGLGAQNFGGPVVTAGGLVFIAATPDSRIRAFDKLSGELLWQDELPAAGFATPAVYEAAGRQFLVIAAGGGKLDQPSGSSYVAYALPTGGN